jgi:hypothetical protein
MALNIFRTAFSLNVCKGFTASKCKISNVYRGPYGFTAPRGYICTLCSSSSRESHLLIILSPIILSIHLSWRLCDSEVENIRSRSLVKNQISQTSTKLPQSNTHLNKPSQTYTNLQKKSRNKPCSQTFLTVHPFPSAKIRLIPVLRHVLISLGEGGCGKIPTLPLSAFAWSNQLASWRLCALALKSPVQERRNVAGQALNPKSLSTIDSVSSAVSIGSCGNFVSSRKAIRQTSQGLARLRKPTQGPRKNSSASLSCKPSHPFRISAPISVILRHLCPP